MPEHFIGWVTRVRKGQAVTLPEVQKAFSNFRYTLYPVIPLLYNGARLFDILTQINMINDSVIFRFSDYFQKYHEQKLKEHADGLEQKVKRRTRELEELGKNYSTLVEEMTDGCFLIHDGKLIFVNRAFCGMHGYALEELLNKPWQRLIAEDSKKMVLDNLTSRNFYNSLKIRWFFEASVFASHME